MKILLLVLVFLFSNESFACSCGGPDIVRMDKGSEFVVLAKLKEKRRLYSLTKNNYVFDTIKVFKGDGIEQIDVWSPKFVSSCGFQPDYEMSYVLFAYREKGKLMVDHCSSWPLTNSYFDYTRNFNEFYKLGESDALKPDSKN